MGDEGNGLTNEEQCADDVRTAITGGAMGTQFGDHLRTDRAMVSLESESWAQKLVLHIIINDRAIS